MHKMEETNFFHFLLKVRKNEISLKLAYHKVCFLEQHGGKGLCYMTKQYKHRFFCFFYLRWVAQLTPLSPTLIVMCMYINSIQHVYHTQVDI